MQRIEPTQLATLQLAKEIANKNGLRYVYIGNVHDVQGSTTCCHNCGTTLIGRNWYSVLTYDLDQNGCCKRCKTTCAGVF